MSQRSPVVAALPGRGRRHPKTPLLKARLGVLLLVFLADALAMAVTLPFTPFLVRAHVTVDHTVGYYSGCLAAAYVLGQAGAAPLWAALAERAGTKPVLLACLLLTSGCLLAFGAAPTLPLALVARFAQGLCSGNAVIAKGAVADLTDASNEDDAFVLIGVVFGAGACVGPLLGGALAEPSTKYAWTPALFDQYPYLLPCLAVAGFSLLVFVTVLCLEETSTTDPLDERQAMHQDEKSRAASEDRPFAVDVRGLEVAVAAEDDAPRSLKALLRDRRCPLLPLLLSFLLCGFSVMAFQEVLPLYARAFVKEGGLGLSTTGVGALQGLAGLATLAGVAYGPLSNPPSAYEAALLLCGLFAYPLPALVAAYAPHWAFAAVAAAAAALSAETAFTSLNAMLKRAAPAELAGAALGAASSLGLAGFALGPVAGGCVFAAASDPAVSLPSALRKGRLAFVVLAALALLNSRLVASLPAWPARGQAWRRPRPPS